jgi:hypothetical protein
MKKQAICKLLNETPGAFRYIEVNAKGEPIKGDEEGALVGDLHLRMAALKGAIPDKITVFSEY